MASRALCIIVLMGAAVAAQAAQPVLEQPPVRFELRGQIVKPDGTSLPGRQYIRVTLSGVKYPHTEGQLTFGGRFKFKKLSAGSYSVRAFVRGFEELQRTVEISPAFAKKNRVEVVLKLNESRGTSPAARRRDLVTVRQLSISDKARGEYGRALRDLRAPRGEKAQSAMRHLERAIQISPGFAEAMNLLGTIHYGRAQWGEAEQSFRRAMEVDPAAYEPLLNLGGVLVNLKRFREALPVNQKAVSMQPRDALAHSQLGLSLFGLGRFDAAIASLNRAKELDPNHFSFPQLALAQIFLKLGRKQEASAEVADFVKRHPDQPIPEYLRGIAPVGGK